MEQNDPANGTSCIFCQIHKGEIPSEKIYENERAFAILDIQPVNIGHALVISKEHFANIYETPEEVLADMMSIAKKLSVAVKNAIVADGINIAMNNNHAAGQVIFHSHIHVIPRIHNDGFELWHGRRGYKEGEMKEIADKIISAL